MSDVLSLYQRLAIDRISYETGDPAVTAECRIRLREGGEIPVVLLLSHTDINRIFARLSAAGFEFDQIKSVFGIPDERSAVIDYTFQNVFENDLVLENFEFVESIKEIRA